MVRINELELAKFTGLEFRVKGDGWEAELDDRVVYIEVQRTRRGIVVFTSITPGTMASRRTVRENGVLMKVWTNKDGATCCVAYPEGSRREQILLAATSAITRLVKPR